MSLGNGTFKTNVRVILNSFSEKNTSLVCVISFQESKSITETFAEKTCCRDDDFFFDEIKFMFNI